MTEVRRKFPSNGIQRAGASKWSGSDVREWAETLAKRVEAGEVEVCVDLDRWGRTADTWKINVFRKEGT